MTRILTAAGLLPVLWLLVKRAPAWTFHVIAGIVLVVALGECYALLEARGARPFKRLGAVAALGVASSFAIGPAGPGPALPLALLVLGAASLGMALRDEPAAMLDAAAATAFPVLLVGLPFGHLMGLRAFSGDDGSDLVLLLFVCVMASDTAALYVGGWLGRHRLAPVVSPQKSWEGAVGGLAASVGGALLAHAWFFQRLPVRHAVVLGVLLAVLGVLGDLAESVLKRAAGVKDSSRLLPGHGGFLDRTDSLLFTAPVLYYYALHVLGIGS
jgi:phosphatidate cytidylyltransferase